MPGIQMLRCSSDGAGLICTAARMGQVKSKTTSSKEPKGFEPEKVSKKKRGCCCCFRWFTGVTGELDELMCARRYVQDKRPLKWLRNCRGRRMYKKHRKHPALQALTAATASPYVPSHVRHEPPPTQAFEPSPFAPAYATLPVPKGPPPQRSWVPRLTFPIIDTPQAYRPSPTAHASWDGPPGTFPRDPYSIVDHSSG